MAQVMPMCEFRNSSILRDKQAIQPSRAENSKETIRWNKGAARAFAILPLAILTFTMVGGLAGCGSEAKAFSSTTSNANKTGLAVSPASIDFGSVDVGKSASQKLSITNEDSAPVKVALSTSSGDFSVDGGRIPASLSAGDSMSVQVHYKPGSSTDATAQLSVNAMSNTLTSSSSTVKLHGRGASSATLSGLKCASSSMIGAGTDNCTVTLTSAAPSTGVSVTLASSSNVITVPSSVTVAAGATSASFVSNVSAVTTSQTVTLIATQGTVSKTTSIKVNGSASNISPTVGAVSCAASSLTGTNTTACTVSLSSPAPSGGMGVTLSSSSSALSVPASVTVGYGATTASFAANASTVTTSQTAMLTASANSSSKSFAIQLNAAVPSLSLSATSLSFGNVSVGTAVTKSVTVTSSGTAAVTINSDSITGTGFSVSGGGFPATLNPGQSAVLTVQFYPTSTNSVTGQLAISSNAPGV